MALAASARGIAQRCSKAHWAFFLKDYKTHIDRPGKNFATKIADLRKNKNLQLQGGPGQISRIDKPHKQ